MPAKKHSEKIPASIEELVNTALSEADDDVAWAAVNALHALGTRDVLKVAQRLCGMTDHRERRLGCDILGQLGVQVGKPSEAFPEECVVTLLDTLRGEFHPAVLDSLFVALSHQGDERAISAVAQHKDHPDANVRHAVVLALSGHDTERAIMMLGELTTDPSPQVRDWATFGLTRPAFETRWPKDWRILTPTHAEKHFSDWHGEVTRERSTQYAWARSLSPRPVILQRRNSCLKRMGISDCK